MLFRSAESLEFLQAAGEHSLYLFILHTLLHVCSNSLIQLSLFQCLVVFNYNWPCHPHDKNLRPGCSIAPREFANSTQYIGLLCILPTGNHILLHRGFCEIQVFTNYNMFSLVWLGDLKTRQGCVSRDVQGKSAGIGPSLPRHYSSQDKWSLNRSSLLPSHFVVASITQLSAFYID